MRRREMGQIWPLLLVLVGFLVCVEGRNVPGRALLQVEQREYSRDVFVPVNSRQPVTYLRNTWTCIEYNVSAFQANTDEPRPILVYLQTVEDKQNSGRISTSVDYILGSECAGFTCSKQVILPGDEEDKPFYLSLVNALHTVPAFDDPAQEDVRVALSMKTCDAAAGTVAGTIPRSRQSGANIFVILFPILAVLAVLLICIAFAYKKRRKYMKQEESTTSSDQAIQGFLATDRRRGLDGPPARTIEDPVPPASYVPPPREAGGDGDAQPGPSHVFNNTLWGKTISTKPDPEASPAADVAIPRHSDDVSDADFAPEGARVGPEEAPEGPKETKVFMNSLYSRLRGSFKSFRSFGDRGSEPATGVKLKTIGSFVKWRRTREGEQPPTVEEKPHNEEEEGFEKPPTVGVYADTGGIEEEKENCIPGAEHLEDSDDADASPFADTGFQSNTARRIIP